MPFWFEDATAFAIDCKVLTRLLETVYERLLAAHVSLAYFAALLALTMGAMALVCNPRRTSNRVWAAGLAVGALWECSVGLAQLLRDPFWFRFAICTSMCALWLVALQIEAVQAPWASLRRHFIKARTQLWLVPLGWLAFTQAYLPSASTDAHRIHTPLYYGIEAVGAIWEIVMLVRVVRMLRSAELQRSRRLETLALFAYLSICCFGVLAMNVVGNWFHQIRVGWVSPGLAMVGALVTWGILCRDDEFFARERQKATALNALRTLLCLAAAAVIITLVRLFDSSGIRGTLFAGGMLALVLGCIPALHHLLNFFVGGGSNSEHFLLAQSKVNALTQSLTDMAAVHDGYREILRQWSIGSAEVFLSGGSFAARWPAEPFPDLLLGRAAHEGAVTPEKLEAAGEQWLAEFHFMVRHQIGAVVCATTPAGERLVAAWSLRAQDGPFTQRELQEARDLLSSMLTGSHFVRMRQRLRGNDRLNFYARYAPQFAHELRNGLYLQTQLLRAIADGRGRDVRPSDAEAGLERTEHVDRLCDHFFNVGSLFNRPIERLNLHDELAGIVGRMRGQFDGGPEIKLRLELDRDPLAEIFGNRELLQMAIHNLVKNAVESSAHSVEVLAARHLDKMHLLIRDNGPGLPDERRIDPFSPGRSGKRDGMGLGLSIVRDCIEAMGGTVGVRFTGLEGTCFEVTLACAARLDGAAASCQFLTPIQ